MSTPHTPSPIEYAVLGVLAAAKRESGPKGARTSFRVWERLHYSQAEIDEAITELITREWVEPIEVIPGMVHYEVAR